MWCSLCALLHWVPESCGFPDVSVYLPLTRRSRRPVLCWWLIGSKGQLGCALSRGVPKSLAPTRPHCNVRPRSAGGGTEASNRPSLGAGGACSACRAMQWPPRHSATPEDGVGRGRAGEGLMTHTSAVKSVTPAQPAGRPRPALPAQRRVKEGELSDGESVRRGDR